MGRGGVKVSEITFLMFIWKLGNYDKAQHYLDSIRDMSDF